MSIQAKSAIGQAKVADGVVISARWGHEKPSFFVVPRNDAYGYIKTWGDHAAVCALYEEDEAKSLLAHGAWIGIRETSCGHVAGWGHAVLTFA